MAVDFNGLVEAQLQVGGQQQMPVLLFGVAAEKQFDRDAFVGSYQFNIKRPHLARALFMAFKFVEQFFGGVFCTLKLVFSFIQSTGTQEMEGAVFDLANV